MAEKFTSVVDFFTGFLHDFVQWYYEGFYFVKKFIDVPFE